MWEKKRSLWELNPLIFFFTHSLIPCLYSNRIHLGLTLEDGDDEKKMEEMLVVDISELTDPAERRDGPTWKTSTWTNTNHTLSLTARQWHGEWKEKTNRSESPPLPADYQVRAVWLLVVQNPVGNPTNPDHTASVTRSYSGADPRPGIAAH